MNNLLSIVEEKSSIYKSMSMCELCKIEASDEIDETTSFKNVIFLQGCSYNKRFELKDGTGVYYCKYNRTKKPCNCYVHVKVGTEPKYFGLHDPSCFEKFSLIITISLNKGSTTIVFYLN